MSDTIQTIRRTTYRFFSGTLLSRFSGMARDMSMAYVFGAEASIAAFMVAFRLANLFRRLFGEGALQSAFIPEFEGLRLQNEERAFTFFRALSVLLSLFLIFLIGLCVGLLAWFLWGTNLHPDNREIILLTLFMFPGLLFICLFGLNTSLLQCEKNYFIPSVAPVAFNGIWILSVLYLKEMPVKQAVSFLAFGVVFASLCQWLMTLQPLWKTIKPIFSLSFWHISHQTLSDLRHLTQPLLLGIFGVAASQINSAVDSLFARFAEVEGPALLWYALRIQQLPLALFGVAIAGALLPPLSRALKAQKRDAYHHFLLDGICQTWMFMLPITATLFVMGDTSVNLLYGRGNFGAQAVIQTTYCLWAYGLGLIPSALVLVLAPANYAQNNYSLPAIASFNAMILNIFLNTLFIIGFGWGAVSVALATSFSAWVNLLILGWNARKSKTLPPFPKAFLQKGLSISLATLIALWGTYEMRVHLQRLPLFSENFLLSASIWEQLVILSCQCLTFGTLLFCCFFLVMNIMNLKIRKRI